jgi:hypothetical protein
MMKSCLDRTCDGRRRTMNDQSTVTLFNPTHLLVVIFSRGVPSERGSCSCTGCASAHLGLSQLPRGWLRRIGPAAHRALSGGQQLAVSGSSGGCNNSRMHCGGGPVLRWWMRCNTSTGPADPERLAAESGCRTGHL